MKKKKKRVPLNGNRTQSFSLFLSLEMSASCLNRMAEVPALLFKKRKLSQMKFSLNEPQIRSLEILTVGYEYLINGPHDESR